MKEKTSLKEQQIILGIHELKEEDNMKPVIRIVLAVFTGAFIMTSITWVNGNENFYTHKVKEPVSLLDIVNPNEDKEYFYETIIIETVTPSETFLMFDSKYDTLSKKLKGKYRR